MEPVTVDQANPGRLLSENFSVAGGLSTNPGDQLSSGVKFSILKNCLADKRLGAILKRPGSLTETIANDLDSPLGIDEYIEGVFGSMPIKRTVISNFNGTFYKNQAGTWTPITKTSYTNFSSVSQTQFAQLGETMLICGGTPAKWKGPSTSIDRIGIVPSTDAITIFDIGGIPGSGPTETVGAMYMMTLYDSATGLESDWSPFSVSTGVVSNQTVRLTWAAQTQTNWDQIKIYRTLDGGVIPYLLTTVAHWITSFNDIYDDSFLSTRAPDQYEHGLPPDTFICEAYAQCFWMRDSTNPYKLVFSKAYDGDSNQLEYYPIDNFVFSNEPITGLLAAPNKLIVFHPRSISAITGFSVDDFTLQPYIPGIGTLFPQSISTNGTYIFFLSESGLVSVPVAGGQLQYISREIDLELQPLLVSQYNDTLFVSSCWNPSLRQFIFFISASIGTGEVWEDSITGSTDPAIAGWETPLSVTDTWEDPLADTSTSTRRVKIWGWSPELSGGGENLWCEYTFADMADGNIDNAKPTCLFHPSPSSDTSDPQQDKTYMGFSDGAQGRIKTTFRRDRGTDDGLPFTAALMTGRIVPGSKIGNFKLFQYLGFMNSYSDPTSDSFGNVQYLKNFDDPQLHSFMGSLIDVTSVGDIKNFPQMKAKHIHLYITDTSTSQSKILLSEFYIQYRERMAQESR